MILKHYSILIFIFNLLLALGANASYFDPSIAVNAKCFKCHGFENIAKRISLTETKTYHIDKEEYKGSVHGKLSCVRCHSDIDKLPHPEKLAKVSCYGNCHQVFKDGNVFDHASIIRDPSKNIHAGNSEYDPTCVSCHTSHAVKSPAKMTKVEKINICLTCHDSDKISEKFNLAKAGPSYYNSFHGKALLYGDARVPICIDCHDHHYIESAVDFPKKSFKMCASADCHPNASEEFTTHGRIHHAYVGWEKLVQDMIEIVYIFLIVGTIGFMLIHNLLDCFRMLQSHKQTAGHEKGKEKFYLRLSLNERIQHGIMAVSFIILVITGFLIKLGPSFVPYNAIGFEVRGLVHRIAGVALILISIYHIFYLGIAKRGREFLKEMIPTLKDLKDFYQNMLYLLRIKNNAPKFTHFNYMEKMEYYALVWGTLVMTVTGIIMWDEKQFNIFEFHVSQIIHSYEAILAALAILVWHFYLVHFRPGKFPMSKIWINGMISEEELKHEHEDEWSKLNKK